MPGWTYDDQWSFAYFFIHLLTSWCEMLQATNHNSSSSPDLKTWFPLLEGRKFKLLAFSFTLSRAGFDYPLLSCFRGWKTMTFLGRFHALILSLKYILRISTYSFVLSLKMNNIQVVEIQIALKIFLSSHFPSKTNTQSGGI